jgi:hypothetical protein
MTVVRRHSAFSRLRFLKRASGHRFLPGPVNRVAGDIRWGGIAGNPAYLPRTTDPGKIPQAPAAGVSPRRDQHRDAAASILRIFRGAFGSLDSEFERTPKSAAVTDSAGQYPAAGKRYRVKVRWPYVLAELFFITYQITWAVLFAGMACSGAPPWPHSQQPA